MNIVLRGLCFVGYVKVHGAQCAVQAKTQHVLLEFICPINLFSDSSLVMLIPLSVALESIDLHDFNF
jgi:hypothetical protein